MAETKQKVKGEYLYYKNKPLVREKDTICYGDFSEKCVLLLEIISYKEDEGVKVPDSIMVQVLDSKDGQILKQAAKNGLYEAFTYGLFWYEKILTE